MVEQAQRVARVTGVSPGEVLTVAKGLPVEPADPRGVPIQMEGVPGVMFASRPGDDVARALKDERWIERRRKEGDGL